MDVFKMVKTAASFAGYKAEEHSPEICLGLGIVGMIGATVFACKGTIKAKKVIEDAKDDFNIIKATEEYGATVDSESNEIEYTSKDAMKDRAIIATRTAIEISKCYGPAVILTGVGISLLLKGHNILKRRNIALIAAYKSINEAYKKYQDKVKELLGETAANELKYGVTNKEIEVDTGKKNKDGTPKIKKEKKKVIEGEPTDFSPYARFFQKGCKGWDPVPEYRKMWLEKLQNWLNEKLRIEKVITLNDVYDELGIPRTQEGQVVGWNYESDKDRYIEFKINEDFYTENANGEYESVILIDFNVDGLIYDSLPTNDDFKNHHINFFKMR